ncbi:MAG: hypothetical protein SR3Q1_03280 [Quinella sp. 3Q1]|nr:hypothetical protein [Quinella sp. 3Q1]MBR3051931.1 hypothetical protein [Selenomonadaceae bacterium]MBR6888132.1 hypothetical protein [Selenomonadaceae bacterium]
MADKAYSSEQIRVFIDEKLKNANESSKLINEQMLITLKELRKTLN